MKILVLNCGSSSVKYSLFDMADASVMASGLVERIGEETGRVKHVRRPETDKQVFEEERNVPDHDKALHLLVDRLTDKETGVIGSTSEIDGLGHRIVHGGESFSAPTRIDDEVVEQIRANIPLAPLHNPAGLTGIQVAGELFAGKPMVAVFDTAFHQTMPREAYLYPLPAELYKELRIRRYGFHGTSHGYVAKKCAEVMGKDFAQTSVITVHLGNGCSMAAVKNGRCIDTSMGLTPLAGLMMGTRCGDIDPAIHAFLAANKDLSIAEIDVLLNKQSGLKGVCGANDMRDIHGMREKGDEQAELALDMFCYRVKHYIGAYLAALNGCDAIVFTAGIGENDEFVRQRSCSGLDALGVKLDDDACLNAPRGEIVDIATADSPTRIYIIPTNEELEIASQTAAVLD